VKHGYCMILTVIWRKLRLPHGSCAGTDVPRKSERLSSPHTRHENGAGRGLLMTERRASQQAAVLTVERTVRSYELLMHIVHEYENPTRLQLLQRKYGRPSPERTERLRNALQRLKESDSYELAYWNMREWQEALSPYPVCPICGNRHTRR